ncbi:DUF551 domain-containing protein [Salmonella enterica subsp. enterica serovar Waycross]|nr:DUF551 domain-containing protein [Salmonella enterica subsp. enterica serovar Waycross]ELC7119512.1 DUF551 domain-containing protein [Salmonella enterica]
MTWFSMESDRPESNGYYIVCTENGVGVATYNRIEGFGQARINGNPQCTHQTVTHWMPFPTAPNATGWTEINADTRFDQAISGVMSAFTLSELEAIDSGQNINEVAPGWDSRQPTGLRLPRTGPRGYAGNDMGHDYMYRYRDGRLSADLPMDNTDI